MLPGCGSYENEIYALANACDDHEPLAFSCMIEEMGQDFPLLADLTSRLPLLSASTYIPYFALPTVSPTEGLDPATAHMPIQGSLSKVTKGPLYSRPSVSSDGQGSSTVRRGYGRILVTSVALTKPALAAEATLSNDEHD